MKKNWVKQNNVFANDLMSVLNVNMNRGLHCVYEAPSVCRVDPIPLRRIRKMTKESMAQTSSDITESLMSISRMMSQQVNQSEETITTLGEYHCHRHTHTHTHTHTDIHTQRHKYTVQCLQLSFC